MLDILRKYFSKFFGNFFVSLFSFTKKENLSFMFLIFIICVFLFILGCLQQYYYLHMLSIEYSLHLMYNTYLGRFLSFQIIKPCVFCKLIFNKSSNTATTLWQVPKDVWETVYGHPFLWHFSFHINFYAAIYRRGWGKRTICTLTVNKNIKQRDSKRPL